MLKKNMLWIIIFILLATPIIAPKPPVVQLSDGSGLNIVYPEKTEFKLGQPFDLNFHIFNSTHFLLTTGVTCHIHVYNYNNSYVFEEELINSTHGDWELEVTQSNTSFLPVGWYPYNLWCNKTSTQEAGYVSFGFWITEQGREQYNDNPIVLSIIILLPLCFAALLLYWASQLSPEHAAFKFFLTMMTPVLMILSLGYALEVYENFYIRESISELLGENIFWVGLFICLVLLYFFISFLRDWLIDKKQRREDGE